MKVWEKINETLRENKSIDEIADDIVFDDGCPRGWLKDMRLYFLHDQAIKMCSWTKCMVCVYRFLNDEYELPKKEKYQQIPKLSEEEG